MTKDDELIRRVSPADLHNIFSHRSEWAYVSQIDEGNCVTLDGDFDFSQICEDIAALPAAPTPPEALALVEAAKEWKAAKRALALFEAEGPGNLHHQWEELHDAADNAEISFWSTLAAWEARNDR